MDGGGAGAYAPEVLPPGGGREGGEKKPNKGTAQRGFTGGLKLRSDRSKKTFFCSVGIS